ncbi:Uncharacterised protein [Escherichia coli]|uniref:Uncharacterized protein n=1 Tax=Escherichia coli TaxID=562 RepID=A0A485J8G9_ECOLX|nr:Uncharacterised protein [Escherichia coli]
MRKSLHLSEILNIDAVNRLIHYYTENNQLITLMMENMMVLNVVWQGILIAYADRRPDKVFTLQGNKARQKAKRPHMRAFRNTS